MRHQMAIAQRWVDMRSQTGPTSRKQREVYVGNLAVGIVTEAMLAEVFDSALESLSPDDAGPPVVGVQIAPDGAYAFAEMRTEKLSDAAMHLDGVELCSRAMRVGRPKGWIDPKRDEGEAPTDAPRAATSDAAASHGANRTVDGTVDAVDHYRAAAVSAAASSSSSRHPPTPLGAPYPMPPPPHRCVLLEDAAAAADLADAAEREAFREEVREECAKCGVLEGVLVPTPPPWASASAECSGRAYAMFQESVAARAAREMLHGRAFDGRTVSARVVSDEEFRAAERGAWPRTRAPPGHPSRCGVLRARNLPREATKEDVANFFEGAASNRRTSSSSSRNQRGRESGRIQGGTTPERPASGRGRRSWSSSARRRTWTRRWRARALSSAVDRRRFTEVRSRRCEEPRSWAEP